MNKTIVIPDNWQQVSIGQFQELSDIPNDSADNILQTVSILIDIDPEEIRGYSIEEFNAIVSKLDWIKEIPNEANFKQVITVDGTNYALIKFAELTGGEWLDLDEYIKNPIGNLHKIMSIMYRELLGGKVDSLILAPYDTESANERAELFKQKMPVGDCYGALVFFFEYRQRVFSDYSGIFHPIGKDEEGVEETEPIENEEMVDEGSNQKWNWYAFFYCLAKGDITKIEPILKLNFLFILTHKSFELENKFIYEHYDRKN